MIPSPYRLKLSNTHPFIGRKRSGKWSTCITQTAPSPQWAVRISKRVIPLAVHRNRLRRQLVQWLYKQKDSLINQSNLIIIKRPPTTAAERKALYNELLPWLT